MAERLRFQTAANIKMGPFVDREDGASPETGMSISLSNVQVSKNGGAFAQKHQSSTPTHDVDGWYLVALDTGDTDTLGRLTVKIHDSGALPVWRHLEIVPQPVYDAEVLGTDNLQVETVAFSDTGVNNRLSRIQAEVDTGIRAHISDVDTGVHDTIAALDTGLRDLIVDNSGDLLRIRGDTGAADRLLKLAGSQLKGDGTFDTGTGQSANTFNITASATLDTGTPVNVQVDTGLLVASVWNYTSRTLTDFQDTGVFDALNKIAADADTGLRDFILDNAGGSGGADTGAIADAVWAKDARTLTNYHDTGIDQSLARIQAEVDTGLRSVIADLDTGLRDYITDTVPSSDITAIKAQTDKLTFDTGNEILADIRKVNNVTVTGTGDTGAGNTWRPA